MITYFIDGIDIRSAYGVHISASNGILGKPKTKERQREEYLNLHGSYVDLGMTRYADREISLSCFIKATTKIDFINKVDEFTDLINAPGLHRLEIALDGQKVLFFEVYNKNAIEPAKKWSGGTQVGTFALRLIEPCPVKRVYHGYISDRNLPVELSVVGGSDLHVFWGDTTHDFDVENFPLSHQYDSDQEEFYIIIAGTTDEITDVSATNTELHEVLTGRTSIIWNNGVGLLWNNGEQMLY